MIARYNIIATLDQELHLQITFLLVKLLKKLTALVTVHCRKKIGDLLIVSQQIQIICSSLGIKIAQFVEH